VSVFDQIAEVDLSAEFQGPAPPEVILLRVAQVVWTLVGRPGITAVRFVIDGQPVSVPTDRGTPIDRPVTAPDYASVAPPPEATVSPSPS
jgi:spore germination protein GerM